jgi:glycosyltransferase involved in cell wall biosynthesis
MPTALVSIILPCYNPVKNWAENVLLHFSQLKKEMPALELIIVSDGNLNNNFTDEKPEQLFNSHSNIKIISYPNNHGKGYALREGVKAAKGEIIIYTDIDFPYSRESFLRLHTELVKGQTDVAVGVRSKEYYTHLPKARVIISKFLRFLIRKFLRIPTDDTQCGLKGFNQKGKDIFLQTSIHRYLFDLEFIFLSARNKLSIKTVPVELREGIQLTSMRWKILLQESVNFVKIFTRAIF